MEIVKEKIRKSREKLTEILEYVADLPYTREVDIFTQKIEEAIMWTYRIVALEYREELDKINDEDFDDEEDEDNDEFSDTLITDSIKEDGLTESKIRDLVRKALYS
jgi:hypothetical protein